MLARAALAALVLAAVAAPAAAAADPSAVVRRTEHGVPHVIADDDAGLGFGYGYAVAQDNACLLAEAYVTVAGERSLYFGPENDFVFYANGARHPNLASDLFYRQVNASGVVDRLLAAPPPVGVDPRVQALVRGYVAGYNRHIAQGVTDPTCRGQPWVRPITERDAYGRFMQLASLAGGGLAITGIGQAQPPPPGAPSGEPRTDLLGELSSRLDLGGLGSNAVALGREASASGAGMVLGNPHLPWDGDGRLYQAHLTIPGELDVQGATFLGVPFVVIGHTRGMAWSHTTSSAFRFTPVELRLVPGDPTSYLVDGEPRRMTSREVTVPLPGGDSVTRRLWSSEHGPILTELLGLPLFPWTSTSAHAFADANAENLRYLNHFYDVDRAQSVAGLEAALRRHQGIPWANTVGADASGRAFYADASVVPHVTDALAERCNTALGVAAFAQLRLPVLDGSRGECRWGSDPDAVVPGIFGPRSLPFLERADYVLNSNDSYWLTNPEQPLEGFARIIGDERTERSLRTRLGLRMLRERERFDLAALQELVFNDRDGAGELLRDDLVAVCREEQPAAVCDALARWDVRDALESRGALLFRRWAERALVPAVPGANAVGGGPPASGTWSDAFDPARPVDTPSRLNASNPAVRRALGDAVGDLEAAGIPLDAPLGDFQFETRGAERIPMHGGPGRIGVFNALNIHWEPGKGYPDIPHGASFLMAAELRGACPPVRTLVAYSQSADPASPWFADQTRMFSRGAWATERFCARDVLASPALQTTRVGCLPASTPLALLAPGTTWARALRRAGRPDRGRRWCVAGGRSLRVAVRRGRVALVAKTERRRARLAGRGWRRAGPGLRRRGTSVAGLRRGRVAWRGRVARRMSDVRLRALVRAARL